ncbi:MAG: REP-associated tyrosine transposase [Chitinophagales bacterium]
MATRYRFGDSSYPHFITYSVVNWIDALSRPIYKDIVVKSLGFCIREKGLILHAWVIMNNHVHLIASAQDGYKLENIMRDHKKFTAIELLTAIKENNGESRRSWMLWLFAAAGKQNPNNVNNQFWQQDNHPIQLTTPDVAMQKLNYIHNNPVRAGIVVEPQHYVYSSAVDYSSKLKGLLPVVHLF